MFLILLCHPALFMFLPILLFWTGQWSVWESVSIKLFAHKSGDMEFLDIHFLGRGILEVKKWRYISFIFTIWLWCKTQGSEQEHNYRLVVWDIDQNSWQYIPIQFFPVLGIPQTVHIFTSPQLAAHLYQVFRVSDWLEARKEQKHQLPRRSSRTGLRNTALACTFYTYVTSLNLGKLLCEFISRESLCRWEVFNHCILFIHHGCGYILVFVSRMDDY